MRAVNIRVTMAGRGLVLMKASFRKNWKFYLQEALGLAIFMFSACFFSGILFGKNGIYLTQFSAHIRQVILGFCMGLTALYIFYSRFTSGSGAQINPAVTLSFLRLRRMGVWDSIFYMIFQFAGGTVAVYIMIALMRENLTAAPLHDVVTIPGSRGAVVAAITEFIIALIMMSMILFVGDRPALKNYSRIFAAALVTVFVIVAGPISGFGMNPARSFASALPANIWTQFWIYVCMPLAGMLGATELYVRLYKRVV